MRILALLLTATLAGAAAADVYVAPGGDDAGAGTVEKPFATLERARDAVRALKAAGLPEGGVTVWLADGDYFRSEPFALTAADGGEAGKPVVYRAVDGAHPRLAGGRLLHADAFKRVEDAALLERLEPGAREVAVCADLRAMGITDYGEFPDVFEEPPIVAELFCNDARMTLARWPDTDWATIAEVVDSGPAPWRNHESSGTGTFVYSGERPARWATAPGVWLHGYWCFDWSCQTLRVKEIDPVTHRMTFLVPHHYGIGSGNKAARRYHALNLLEEMDQPGEYYIDREAGRLYFIPPVPLSGARVVLSTMKVPVITVQDAAHITLRGLCVETCAGNGIEVKGCESVHIDACAVRNTGRDAIRIEGGMRCRVAGCDVYDTGAAGVALSGGDRPTLTPCGHEAVNNHIYRVSRRQRTHAYHLHLAGVGIRAANNLLHDGPHQAIGLWGNDHVVELNDIHHVGMETDDCGAFYMGRNPSERGSVIRHNYWHDIGSTLSHGSCAIYFDDGSGGQSVEGNIFVRACGGNFGAVFVHGGHDNIVENNVFIECNKAVAQVPWDDARWAQFLIDYGDRLLKDVDITGALYCGRYPDLRDYLKPGTRPRINTARRNVAWQCGKFAEGNWKLERNLFTETDPGFVDAAAGNYALKPDAPALTEVAGFKPIPFDTIGLYMDDLRPVLPNAGGVQ